jgi:hypothetical protein
MEHKIIWKGQELCLEDLDPDVVYLIETLLFNKIKPIGDHKSFSKERARLRTALFGEKNAEHYVDTHID